MNDSIEYMLAQYLPNPLRREPRNIGLIVLSEQAHAARFLGESDTPGEIDGRSVSRWNRSPPIYRKWVRSWRRHLSRGGEQMRDRLMARNGGSYDIIEAGYVTETNGDSLEDICNNLFAMLVARQLPSNTTSEEVEDTDASSKKLQTQITNEFRRLELTGKNARIPHPILLKPEIPGSGGVNHTPAYYQEGGETVYVMEALSFTTARKAVAKYHAGFAANMFKDIVQRRKGRAEAIAIVTASSEDMADSNVKYAHDMLKESANRIVNWLSPLERREFLAERQRVGYSNGQI